MLYFIIIIIAITIFILTKNLKNIYYILFSLSLLALSIILFSNIMYILRISTFTYSHFEGAAVYTYLMHLPLTISDIKTMLNIALSIFVCLSSILFLHDIKYAAHKVRDLTMASVFVVCSLFVLLVLQSPDFFEGLYIRQNISGQSSIINAHFIVSFLTYTIFLFCFVPIIKLLYQLCITKIIYKKKLLTWLIFVSTASYISFFIVLFCLPISNIFTKSDIYAFSGWSDKNITSYTFWISSVCFIIAVSFILLVQMDVLNNKIFKQHNLRDKSIIYANDIRNVFHSYKNVLFSIKTIAEKAAAIYGKPEGLALLTTIKSQAENFSQKVGNFLDIYNKVDVEYAYTDIRLCVSDAINIVHIPDNIQINFDILSDRLFFFGDYELMREVFVNLLSNSVDAINKKKDIRGIIKIVVWDEPPWLCISLTDNGIGIDHKIKEKIFRPLYSTKGTINNLGLGLSYAQNVIKAHSGYINFKSIPEKKTEFQIILPL